MDNVVLDLTVTCFPNNKPWIIRDIKALLNGKMRAFWTGDMDELRLIQREFRIKIKKGTDTYRRKRWERHEEHHRN